MRQLPVTVGVPLTKSRLPLFLNMTLPAIRANLPAEILIDDAEEHANVKRNRLMSRAHYPYVLLCDDDVILSHSALGRLLEALQSAPPNVGYAYGDFLYVNHPRIGNALSVAGSFDADRLRRANYISMISLIRKSAFPGMDPDIDRFQDWDLWLHMLADGYVGLYVPPRKAGEALFAAYYGSDGISNKPRKQEAMDIVRRKYPI